MERVIRGITDVRNKGFMNYGSRDPMVVKIQ